MTEFIIIESPAIVRQHLVADASEGVERVMNELLTQFIVENHDAVNERLAAFGITIDRLLQPEWKVTVRAGDLEMWGSPEQKRDAVVDMMARVNAGVRRRDAMAEAFGRAEAERAR